nr:Uncharacterised protein [Streptococcus thermophilus]
MGTLEFGELGFNLSWVEVLLVGGVFLLAVASFALFIWAIASIMRADYLDGVSKLIWVIVCAAFPLVGSLLWLFLGRNRSGRSVEPDYKTR